MCVYRSTGSSNAVAAGCCSSSSSSGKKYVGGFLFFFRVGYSFSCGERKYVYICMKATNN